MKTRLDWRIVALLVGLAILIFCWWNWAAWQRKAGIAAGFGARIACSCRYVEGRGLDSCDSDFAALPQMRFVHLRDRPEERTVEAGIPFLASRSARAVPEFGCVIEPE